MDGAPADSVMENWPAVHSAANLEVILAGILCESLLLLVLMEEVFMVFFVT